MKTLLHSLLLTSLLFLLRVYKVTISPFLGQNCRFYPSCSDYAQEAIRKHGVLKGSALTGKRLCKCHPWHPGGADPVPEKQDQSSKQYHASTESRLKYARSCNHHHHN